MFSSIGTGNNKTIEIKKQQVITTTQLLKNKRHCLRKYAIINVFNMSLLQIGDTKI